MIAPSPRRALVPFALLLAPAAALAQAHFRGLGGLPGHEVSYAGAVSANGQRVSGYSAGASELSAWRWTAGVLEPIQPPVAGVAVYGRPLNHDGSVMAGELGPGQRPFRWTQAGGVAQDLGFPANTNHLALGMSADGSVITGAGGSSPVDPRAYRWTQAGGVQYLPIPAGFNVSAGGFVSADGTVIAGSVGTAPNGPSRACVWSGASPGGMVIPLPPGATWCSAGGISGDGLVVTGSMGDGTFRTMLRWTLAGGPQDLGGELAAGRGLSADGSVIVGTALIGQVWRAVMWSEATGLVDLTEYLAGRGVDLVGWTLDDGLSVSANGRVIVGQGTRHGVQEGWIVTLPPACYANCDESTAAPVLNIADFACFLGKFAAGDGYANCDASLVSPRLNIADFSCFLLKFAGGCP